MGWRDLKIMNLIRRKLQSTSHHFLCLRIKKIGSFADSSKVQQLVDGTKLARFSEQTFN